MSNDKEPLLIIDGYGFIFRAYHVQPPLTSPNGEPVGAIYGFTSMLLKLLADFKPKYAVIILDHAGKNFRHDLYNEYKANRPPAPDDLKLQLAMVEKAAQALNFTCISKQGYEADDIIATLAVQAKAQNHPAIIVSADKDLMQLVNHSIKMYDPAKYKYITEEDIFKKFGVSADKVREVQALIGDKSDNIPGVPSIGPKTSAQLINQYGDVENLLNSIDELSPRQQALFSEHKELALLSWKLVGLDDKVEIDVNFEDLKWTPPEVQHISDFVNEKGFKSLHKRIENLFKLKITQLAEQKTPEQASEKITKHVIDSPEKLAKLVEKVKKSGHLAVKFEESHNLLLLSCGENIYEIKLGEVEGNHEDIFAYNAQHQHSQEIKQTIFSLLSDSSIKKITWDLKELQKKIKSEITSAEDIMIMDYVLNAGKKGRVISDIIQQEDEVYHYIASYKVLRQELIAAKLLHLYYDADLPLVKVLFAMEQEGIKIDVPYLAELSQEIAEKIVKLESEIYEITGEKFNIASPKQLGVILFEKLKLPFGKLHTKSQNYSTNVDILEKLKIEGHKIADLLLEYRHFSKLQNTYIEALPKLVDSADSSRVHTTFLQCSTSTSRLSSVNPNLQNIPVRTVEGEKVRSAFIAKPGYKLISADYSQIELRILSYVANITSLKEAFTQGVDIHAQTASQIFKVPLEQITPEIRRKAKAINFGIIYGISAFGLAKQLNISQKEATEYIKLYFQEYPGIEKYMKDIVTFAEQHGFVQNALGRKCYLPTINDKNYSLRAFAQRAAINAPMQSLAADIVKLSMIKLARLLDGNFTTKMILQIHDELIFEAPEDEVEQVMPRIKSVMEEMLPFGPEKLSFKVDIRAGNNWQEIH